MTSRAFRRSVVRRQRWWAAGLSAVAVVWVLVNGPVEGRVLLVLTPTHGVTVADLPSLAALVVAGALVVRSLSSAARQAPTSGSTRPGRRVRDHQPPTGQPET